MYRLNPHVDTNGIDGLTLFEFPPAGLVELFGDTGDGDGYKISRRHVFTSERGDVFTVYDWKETTLYRGSGSGAPTPEEFWRSQEWKILRVGGRIGTNPRPFLKWLQAQYELCAATGRLASRPDAECA